MNVLNEFKNYKRKFIQISHRDKNLFKRYNELKRSIREAYDKLEEYKTTYNNFILELNESNRN